MWLLLAHAYPSGAGHRPIQHAAEGLTQVCVSAAALIMELQSYQMVPKKHFMSHIVCICQTVLPQAGTMPCLRQSSAFPSF